MAIPARKPIFLPTAETEASRNWNDQRKWAVLCALVDPEQSIRDSLLREFDNIDNNVQNNTTPSTENAEKSKRPALVMGSAKVRVFRQKMNERITDMVDNWKNNSWMRQALGPFFSVDANQGLSMLELKS